MDGADILVTATSAQAPLLKAAWMKPGAFYSHIGGREEEYAVARRCEKIVCDDWETVKHRTQTLSRMYKDRDSTMALGRPATIVFTSGSAGVPKAVLHTCGNHYYNALGSNINLPLTSGDRWLLNLPLHHVAGLGIHFRCLLAGAAVVLPARGETLDAALSRYEVTHLSAVTTQLRRSLNEPRSVTPNRWPWNPLVARPSRGANGQLMGTRGPAGPGDGTRESRERGEHK